MRHGSYWKTSLVWIGLAAAVTICLAGCTRHALEDTVSVYAEDSSAGAGFRQTVLFYATQEGLIVPVTRMIPWEEGIGKAALGYLVDTPENGSAVDARGLRALIPAGTAIKLRIGDDGHARVALTGDEAAMPAEAQAMRNMATAIVNTLTEFAAIDTVSITYNGKSFPALMADAGLSETMSAFALNTEDGAVPTGTQNAYAMTLYFPNEAASLNVPVTRYAAGSPTFSMAVKALLEGPRHEGLLACFPEGTRVLDAAIDGKEAMVDLSAEYAAVADTDGLALACFDALYLTAREFAEVETLTVCVEGKPYAPLAGASAPRCVNEFR